MLATNCNIAPIKIKTTQIIFCFINPFSSTSKTLSFCLLITTLPFNLFRTLMGLKNPRNSSINPTTINPKLISKIYAPSTLNILNRIFNKKPVTLSGILHKFIICPNSYGKFQKVHSKEFLILLG